jgi:colicin import membrane protein
MWSVGDFRLQQHEEAHRVKTTGTLLFFAGIAGLIRPAWLRSQNRRMPAAVLAIGLLVVAIAGGAQDGPVEQAQVEKAALATDGKQIQEPHAEEPPLASKTPRPGTVKKRETVSQKNAVRKAKEYLSIAAFSKKGLIEQLEFEGFSSEDGTYAADKIDVNWQEQAAKSAKQYLSLMAFSRKGLIEQLEFEGYTLGEATYAADRVGL